MSGVHVVKLGGSLLDADGLLPRLFAWLDRLPAARLALLVGGGEAADLIRVAHARFGFDEEAAHWLALRAMQLNAHVLAAASSRWRLADGPDAAAETWDAGFIALLDPLPWLRREAAAGVNIPHRWSFTSDSVAAHLAGRLDASRLTLLKSTIPGPAYTPERAAEVGVVDPDFPAAARGLPRVELVNLRAGDPTHPDAVCALR